MQRKSATGAVPRVMQIQLARLFGGDSAEARSTTRTSVQWRATLAKVLRELEAYLEENVDTDELHRLFLESGLFAARESLGDDDFWPGYVEGITRFSLILMGDYPDHRRRKAGRKKDEHYRLRRSRSIHYTATPEQRLFTMFAAGNVNFPGLALNPRDAMAEFRDKFCYSRTYRQFLRWYKKTYPRDYALLF